MRILITGGTGFIGTNLALDYVRSGHEVHVISKEATPTEVENAADLKKVGVTVVRGNITDHGLLDGCCKDVDVVHHIAAAMREANIPDSEFWNVNLESTRRLLESARKHEVQRFVYCSSIGAIGKTPEKPANEESPCKPEDIYQKTKKAAEELCLEFQRTHDFPLSIVRPAEVYGPRDRRLLKLFKAIKHGKFAMIGAGRNEHHLVYIDDMVLGFKLAAEQPSAIGQVFIIAGEEPIALNDLVQLVAKTLGVAPPKLRIPLLPIQIVATITEGVCKPLRIQPPIYRRRVDFFRSDFSFSIKKAKEVLNYQPQFDNKTGVRRTMEWYESDGLL
jgi:dihydroflavonol-4-reductase